MNLIDTLIGKLQEHPKRFLFPDGEDARVLQAARQIVSLGMGVPILLGDRARIKKKAAMLDLSMEKMRVIEIERSSDLAALRQDLRANPRFADLPQEVIEAMSLQPNTFACLMLMRNQADAIVTGAMERASSALRPLLRIVGTQEGVSAASSLLILDLEAKGLGMDGALFMGDCAVIPQPTAAQLADIAVNTASLAHHLTRQKPKIAMLSYATQGLSQNPTLVRIREATAIAKEKATKLSLDLDIEGEMQVDTALDRATAIMKGMEDSSVAGSANVLIFPDLNSGNISSKLVQILTGANKYGQIIMGLNKPAAEISRSATAHDILGAATIVGCQAIDNTLLASAVKNC